MISLALHILAWWLSLSLLTGLAWSIAGLRITRMQERNSFAWDKPLRYYDAQPHEYRRLD